MMARRTASGQRWVHAAVGSLPKLFRLQPFTPEFSKRNSWETMTVSRMRSHYSPELVILRQVTGARAGLTATAMLTCRLRQVMLSRCRKPVPPWIAESMKTHATGGGFSEPLALVPLPRVSRQCADGRLMGVALVLPCQVPYHEALEHLTELFFESNGDLKRLELKLGKLGNFTVMLDDGTQFRPALRAETWCGPSQRWATVTPIGLERVPRTADHWYQVEQQIARACGQIGLPRPARVIASVAPILVGVPDCRQMPLLTRRGGGPIRHAHAVLEFPQPVQGPVLLGLGRHRGYGWCYPLRDTYWEGRSI